MTDIKFPFGAADVQALTATGDQDLTITDALTVIDGQTVSATGNRTLNLTVTDVQIGALLFFKSTLESQE